MAKQKFTLDVTNILGEMTAEQISTIDPIAQSFIIERYNPIIAELEKLYKESSKLDKEDKRLKKLCTQIEDLLRVSPGGNKLIKKTSDLKEALGDSNSTTTTHLAFVLQSLKSGKKLQEVMDGYKVGKENRVGLIKRFKGQFIADFIRNRPQVVDQKGTILDSDIFASVNKYTKLKAMLAELKDIYESEPKMDHTDLRYKRVTEIGEALRALSKGLSDEPTLIPSISKKNISKHLDFIIKNIDQEKRLDQIMEGDGKHRGVLKRFEKGGRWFDTTSYNDALRERLNLSDEQLKLLVSRYHQRSLVGADVSLYPSLATDTRKEFFHVRVDGKGSPWLQSLEYQCIPDAPALGDDGIPIVDDETNKSKTIQLHRISHITDVSNLQKNDQPGERFFALPTQNARETLTYEAMSPEGANYQLPEALKHRTLNNQLLSGKKALSLEKIKELAFMPGIEKELLPQNLMKLVSLIEENSLADKMPSDNLKQIIAAASKQDFPIAALTVKTIIGNEVDQVRKDNPKSISITVQDNLAEVFNQPKMKGDKLLSANLEQYIKHKEPSILTKISQYIHAICKYRSLDRAHYQKEKTDRNIVAATLMVGELLPKDTPMFELNASKLKQRHVR